MNKDKIKELIFSETEVEASVCGDRSRKIRGRLVGYDETADRPFIVANKKNGNVDFWKYIREIRKPKLVPLTNDDYNGEPVRMGESMAKWYPVTSTSIGIELGNGVCSSYYDLFDKNWQWFSNGKWQRMAKVEGGER